MTSIIGAPTLDAALAALSSLIGAETGDVTIFCEDKLTLLAEKAAVAHTKGTFTATVTTFKRFLKGDRAILSKQGSVMEIASILSEYRDVLHCFRKGAAQAVYETIAQLLSSRADAALLRMSAAETEGMLSHKLSDLAFVLEKYQGFLAERGLLDENGYLALLPQRIEEELRGRHIVFFAFPSFTRQALEGVKAALGCGRKVTGIFLAGKGGAYTNEAAHVFRLAAEQTGEVSSAELPADLSGDAAFVAENLFSPEIYGREKCNREHIRLFRAADENGEMETVCAVIKKYVLTEGLRYRDFAVLLPDRNRFPQAERMLKDYRIPFFSDRKRPLSEHPFCRFVLGILACVHDGGLPESVDAVLSSVYFGDADDYRNYLLKYGGYRGAVNRGIREDAAEKYDRERLSAMREKLRAILALFPRTGMGKTYTAAVRSLYESVGGEEITEKLSEKFGGAEREFLGVAPIGEILDEIDSIAGEMNFTALEFSDLLKSGLEAKEIAMIPQSADAVFLGDATESRFARVEVLFLLGADESLPRASGDTAVITDGEIKRLHNLSVEIEPQIGVVNMRAKESLYLNLCAFRKDLYVGCPLRIMGEEARRGEAYLSIERMCFGAPMPDLYLYKSCERAPALRNLLRIRDDFEAGREKSRVRYSSLCAVLRETEELRFLSESGKKPSEKLPALLFGGQISPSLLESYFACPYSCFAAYGLRLREREERNTPDADTGNFIHSVLERVAHRFNGYTDEEESGAAAESVARELLATPRYAFLADTGAGAYTGERLVKECGSVARACFRQVYYSDFRVGEQEREIFLPALRLRGRTDRVDNSGDYVRIIDYKTGDIDDSPGAYYTGRKLQLELYLLAVSESDGKIPAGAFYFPARDEFSKGDAPPFRMKGFFVKDDGVLARMDKLRTEGKSAFYEGGGRSEKGLPQKEFEDFLGYALLVSERAIEEMKEGNIAPSPYDDACGYCKFKGMCGFQGVNRKEPAVTCAQIAAIAKAERGEE